MYAQLGWKHDIQMPSSQQRNRYFSSFYICALINFRKREREREITMISNFEMKYVILRDNSRLKDEEMEEKKTIQPSDKYDNM